MLEQLSIPRSADSLLLFIRATETGRADLVAYDTIYGHNQHKLKQVLTESTVKYVLDNQRHWASRYGSSASGAYQIIRKTLMDLCRVYDVKAEEIFDREFQDQLGYRLLKRRQYDAWDAGDIDDVVFAKYLAQEWASLPVLATTKGAHRTVRAGQSYYAGDGLNKALVSVDRMREALDKAKEWRNVAVPEPKPEPEVELTPEEEKKFMSYVSKMIGAAAGGAAAWMATQWGLPEEQTLTVLEYLIGLGISMVLPGGVAFLAPKNKY